MVTSNVSTPIETPRDRVEPNPLLSSSDRVSMGRSCALHGGRKRGDGCKMQRRGGRSDGAAVRSTTRARIGKPNRMPMLFTSRGSN